jgi:predicted secreted protein
MDKKLARKNLRTALIATIVIVLMFAMTYVAAFLYTGL